MAEVIGEPGRATSVRPHARWVRISHWIATASVLTLTFSGAVILMAHPRLYWGEVGNDLTPALIELPISRNYQHGGWEERAPFFADAAGPISAVRTYDIFNQNGWARSLHFLAAWWLVLPGIVYLLTGVFGGHFRTHVWRPISSGARSWTICGCGYRLLPVVRATGCCRNARTRS
jgi:hypothetical protein